MADYDTLESSVESSRPIEVFDFSLGADSFRYTSSEDDVIVGVDTFEAEAIRRGSIIQGSDDRDAVLEITIPAQNTFVRKYIDIVPGQLASVSIIRVQRDEPTPWTQALVFKGFVQSVKFPKNGHEAGIAARSIESSASRPIPRFTYQSLCNNFLYDDACGANASLYKFTGPVTLVEENKITVTGASGQPNGYYNAGYVKPTGIEDFRMILDHTGDVLTLLLPFAEALTGTNVDIFAGCDHAVAGHCNTRFSNVGRHAGFAFVPTINPFQSGIS